MIKRLRWMILGALVFHFGRDWARRRLRERLAPERLRADASALAGHLMLRVREKMGQ